MENSLMIKSSDIFENLLTHPRKKCTLSSQEVSVLSHFFNSFFIQAVFDEQERIAIST